MARNPGAARERFRAGDARDMERIVVTRFVLIAAILASVAPGSVEGKSDSLCVRISGNEPGARVTLVHGYTLSGALPVSFCGIEPGVRYRLILDGAGFERRVGIFSIDGGAARVGGIQALMAAKNIVLPGWGSASAGRASTALCDDIGMAASLGLLLHEEMEYRDQRDRIDALDESFSRAETWADRARLQVALHEASREVNIQNDRRLRLAIFSGALYAWQVIEPFFVDNPPKSPGNQAKGEIALRGTHQSRPKAFIYSLVRPGRGQFYQGKTTRGVFFSAATLVAGLVVLDYQTGYEYAADDYELCIERFNAADVVSEKERIRDEAVRLWSDVEHNKDRRDASLIALAAFWGWNVIDTFIPAERRGPGAKYSFDLDARGASIAMRF
jgi:hypothetical protein